MARRFNIVDGASSSVGMGKLHSTVQSVHGFYKRLSFNLTKLEASSARFGSRSGQAMAEFLVGLVGIMFLVVGLQQIAFPVGGLGAGCRGGRIPEFR